MEGKGTPFFSFLVTCATVKEKACDWTPAAVVAGSTLLKYANECNSIPHFSHDQTKWKSGFSQ